MKSPPRNDAPSLMDVWTYDSNENAVAVAVRRENLLRGLSTIDASRRREVAKLTLEEPQHLATLLQQFRAATSTRRAPRSLRRVVSPPPRSSHGPALTHDL